MILFDTMSARMDVIIEHDSRHLGKLTAAPFASLVCASIGRH